MGVFDVSDESRADMERQDQDDLAHHWQLEDQRQAEEYDEKAQRRRQWRLDHPEPVLTPRQRIERERWGGGALLPTMMAFIGLYAYLDTNGYFNSFSRELYKHAVFWLELYWFVTSTIAVRKRARLAKSMTDEEFCLDGCGAVAREAKKPAS